MKTRVCILFAAIFMICVFASSLPIAIAQEALPTEVANSIMEMELLDSAHAALSEGDYWFVLVRAEDETNSLKCFKRQEGRYALLFETESAIPDGTNEVLLEIEPDMEDMLPHVVYHAPVLTISQTDAENEYIELFTAYQFAAEDTWELVRLWNYTEFGNILFEDEVVQFYEDIETDQLVWTEPVKIERDLRYLDLSSLFEDLKHDHQWI